VLFEPGDFTELKRNTLRATLAFSPSPGHFERTRNISG